MTSEDSCGLESPGTAVPGNLSGRIGRLCLRSKLVKMGGEGRFDWRRQKLWVGLLALAFFVGAVVWQYTSGPSNGQEVFM